MAHYYLGILETDEVLVGGKKRVSPESIALCPPADFKEKLAICLQMTLQSKRTNQVSRTLKRFYTMKEILESLDKSFQCVLEQSFRDTKAGVINEDS